MSGRGADTSAGYSGKPLFQKLGLKAGMRHLAMNAPAHYPDLIAASEATRVDAKPADLVHLFCANRTDLETNAAQAVASVAPSGMLWVSWPKKSSPAFVDLTEDGLRAVLLPMGWVDVKVCAVDKDWSGLKFLRRKNPGR